MKLTVQQTAQVLGVTPQFVRIGIQTGMLDVGACVKLGKSQEKYTYCVVPSKVAQFMGITLDELERRVSYTDEAWESD